MIELNITDNEARLLHSLILNYLSIFYNIVEIDYKNLIVKDELTLTRIANNLENAINLN
jgi:hypothetical protein